MASKRMRLGIGGGELADEQWRSIAARVDSIDVETTVLGLPGVVDHAELLIDHLRRGDLDCALIPTRQLPLELPAQIELAAVPPRRTPLTALISNDGIILDEFGDGAVIGVEGPIQLAQVIHYRPELRPVVVSGVVRDSLRILDEQEIDALIFPAAFAEWMNLQERVSEILSLDVLVPPAGQGSVSVLVRAGDPGPTKIVQALDDGMAKLEVLAERMFVRWLTERRPTALAAALARQQGDDIRISGMAIDCAGRRRLRHAIEGPAVEAESLAVRMADELLDMHGGERL
jgi:hydroxymethylbilane synthase